MTAMTMKEITTALHGAKVLVLGGSGVIGSRLVEVLAGEIGAEVAVVVRTLSKAVRLARHPVHLIPGDVRDPLMLDRAMEEFDLVIDLTYPKEGPLSQRCKDAIEMAGTIAEAAVKRNVRRLVHLSTFSVYGPLRGEMLDETAARRPGADPYGAGKLAGENEMLRHAREQGAPIVILQPTVVYGPFAGWTLGPIQQLRSGTVVLPDEGRGICNAVYLDDVVQAILRATVVPDIEGEVFLVSGDPVPTWKDFYGAYEAMLGFTSTQAMDTAAIRAHLKAQTKAARPMRQLLEIIRQDGTLRQTVLKLPGIAQVYAAARSLLPEAGMEGVKDHLMNRTQADAVPAKPLLFPSAALLGIMASNTRVSVEKARVRLGFVPVNNLDVGMQLTNDWAEWGRLLEEPNNIGN